MGGAVPKRWSLDGGAAGALKAARNTYRRCLHACFCLYRLDHSVCPVYGCPTSVRAVGMAQ